VERENTEAQAAGEGVPQVVEEELSLLRVILNKIDSVERRPRVAVDHARALIELRDAFAEAKPEDEGAILEQMHRLQALAHQQGKGDSVPVDRGTPYFAHMRLLEGGRRRDVVIGQRGQVELGGGVKIVDWRHAPVSKLFYRYDEGDDYEEMMGGRLVEGEVLARRTVAIVNAELRRVASSEGVHTRDGASPGGWFFRLRERESHDRPDLARRRAA
jgi:DNA helicase-2/ATP-dependent DNA helicase PcrA